LSQTSKSSSEFSTIQDFFTDLKQALIRVQYSAEDGKSGAICNFFMTFSISDVDGVVSGKNTTDNFVKTTLQGMNSLLTTDTKAVKTSLNLAEKSLNSTATKAGSLAYNEGLKLLSIMQSDAFKAKNGTNLMGDMTQLLQALNMTLSDTNRTLDRTINKRAKEVFSIESFHC
jgi:hypothetical protein